MLGFIAAVVLGWHRTSLWWAAVLAASATALHVVFYVTMSRPFQVESGVVTQDVGEYAIWAFISAFIWVAVGYGVGRGLYAMFRKKS